MNKVTKKWLAIATALVIIGTLTFTSVMTFFGWDFTKLSTVKFETNTYEIKDKFANISINTDIADIIFAPSENNKCKVVCFEMENVKHSADVKDNTLLINVVDERKWYENIGIMTDNPTITIYLPKNEYDLLTIDESTGDVEIPKNFEFENIDISATTGDVKNYASTSENIKIETSTGDIILDNLKADKLDLSVTTGQIDVTNVECKGDVSFSVSTGESNLTDLECGNLTTTGSTGDINLNNVIAKKKLDIERSTGDVSFDRCDADEILVNTSTGDVTGSLLTEKVFIAQTDTGNIDIPETTTGGKCEINTSTGDIEISIH